MISVISYNIAVLEKSSKSALKRLRRKLSEIATFLSGEGCLLYKYGEKFKYLGLII
jgi:hypothetical protein